MTPEQEHTTQVQNPATAEPAADATIGQQPAAEQPPVQPVAAAAPSDPFARVGGSHRVLPVVLAFIAGVGSVFAVQAISGDEDHAAHAFRGPAPGQMRGGPDQLQGGPPPGQFRGGPNGAGQGDLNGPPQGVPAQPPGTDSNNDDNNDDQSNSEKGN